MDEVITLSELCKHTAAEISASIPRWTDFLDAAARLYKYPYHEQLQIYAQKRDATACASAELWNTRLHRITKDGAQAIALIDDTSPSPGLRYVFDVADTQPIDGSTPPPFIWSMRREYEKGVGEALVAAYGAVPKECDDFAYLLGAIAGKAVLDGTDDAIEDLLSNRPGSLLEELDEYSTAVFIQKTAISSVTWCIMSRCGLQPDAYIAQDEFFHLREFDTYGVFSCLGAAVSNISAQILRHVELSVKKQIKQTLAKEGGFNYENQLSKEGRVPDPQSGAGDEQRELRKVRDAAPELSEGESAGHVQRAADAGGAERASGGDRQGGAGAGDGHGGGHEGESGRHRGAEGPGHAGVDGTGKRAEAAGGGAGTEGSDLQLKPGKHAAVKSAAISLPKRAKQAQAVKESPYEQLSLFAAVEVAPAAEDAQYTIDSLFPPAKIPGPAIEEVLKRGSNHDRSLLRICAHYQEGWPEDDCAAFLQNEYREGGRGVFVDGKPYAVWYSSEGIRICPGKEARYAKRAMTLPWAEVEQRIRAMLEAGRYVGQVTLDWAMSNEYTECASALCEIRHDLSEPGQFFASELYNGWGTEQEEKVAAAMAEPEGLGGIVDELERFTQAYVVEPRILDYHYHHPTALLERLRGLQRERVSFRAAADFIPPSPEGFISEDEVDAEFTTRATHRIYDIARQYSGKELADELKHDFGTSGHSHAFLTDNGWADFTPAKGMRLSRPGCETVKQTWTAVARRIKALVTAGRYLPADELEPREEDEEEEAPAGEEEQPAGAENAVREAEGEPPTAPQPEWLNDEAAVSTVMAEYNAYKEQYPDHIVALQVGELSYIFGSDAELAAPMLGAHLLTAPFPGASSIPMTGFHADRWALYGGRIWGHGQNVLIVGQGQDGGRHVVKELLAKDYIPQGGQLTIDDRRFEVESVDFAQDRVSLRDLSFQAGTGFPVFRTEPVSVVRSYWEEQQDTLENITHTVARELSSEEHVEPPARNFRITDDHLGEGGPKTKFAANIAAIETLKRIEAEGRKHATPEEQEILHRYVGWGGIQEAFDSRKGAWEKEYEQLKALLTPEEYKAAMESVLNAHYTCPVVIKAIYQAVESMGFRAGNLLEPGLGVGNFFGLLPEAMAGTRLYGSELDPVTGRIAKMLYPKARIQVKGFEKTNWPDNFFDVAVGNVPFGQYHVADPKYDKLKFSIHDYFFAKAIDQVRPGGVIAFITSHYTLDKKDSTVRRYIAQRCELLGAIRLPNNAFRANAGTDVTADIVFLQKREGRAASEPDWVQVGRTEGGLTVNQYFIDQPGMVLGTLTADMNRRMYGSTDDVTCVPIPGADLAQQLARAIQNIHAAIPLFAPVTELEDEALEPLPADPEVENFSFTQVGEHLYYRENAQMNPVTTSKTGSGRIKGLLLLRDAVRRLIDAQMDGCDDATLFKLQQDLTLWYEHFTAEYGLINSRGNAMAFSDDSSYPLLCALEILKPNGELESRADIFTKRTIRQWTEILRADTPVEALGVSIGERAGVDLTFMAQLLSRPGQEEAIAQELEGVIFRDPKAGDDPLAGWQAADEYLSGDVRQKLVEARYYAEKEPGRYAANVKALEDAQAPDLDPHEISVRLGTTWIPAKDIEDFVFELLDTPQRYRKNISVIYSAQTDTWYVQGKSADGSDNVRANVTFGTSRINAYGIIQETLNLKDVRIFDLIRDEDGNEKRVLNGKQTTIAQQKQSAIKDAFRDWIWKDPARRQRLCRYYNDTFNSTSPRTYDGSHIRFVGMNPEIKLNPHQVNGVARILYGGNTLLAHVVGAGKTWTMAAAAMEMKRLGLCKKSLFVVPNHLTEQWGADIYRLYPAAKILVSTKKDFERANRKRFCARIATGDYDVVVIGQSQFERIPVSEERQAAQLEKQIDEIGRNIAALKAEQGENYTIKQMIYSRKLLEEKLKNLASRDNKDDAVTFEELGVDRLFVDEADLYKNLYLYTKMRNVAGIGQADAKRSSDLFMKCQYMDELTAPTPGQKGQGIVFATGTPISNSMCELYTMMRYLQRSMLEQKGLAFFDAWASTFGETVTAIELKPEGTGYRAKTRFSKFYNLPELMSLWREVTDIQTAEMLNLPVPKANNHVVNTQPTEFQKDLVKQLGLRADSVRSGSVDPKTDNMLSITSDGRKLALDQRLVDPALPDDPNSKVNACVENVFRIWQETAEEGSAQLIFCDMSTPKGTIQMVQAEDGSFVMDRALPFCVYEDIRFKLLEMGVPPAEIAFIHDYNTDARKASLFAKVRAGEVRILMGSTAKMGAGTNVQTRLKALHDLDIPWRPRDLEQRAGRIVRQGNNNEEVDLYRYVTEGTFDAYSYQTLETKQRFIAQLMSGKNPARTCEDVDETALNYAEIKALCAGDPLIKEKMDLDVEVSKLETLRANYLSEIYRLQDNLLKKYPGEIKELEEKISAYKADLGTLAAHTPAAPEQWSMVVDGATFRKEKLAGEALLAFGKTLTPGEDVEAGSYRGFTILLRKDKNFFDTTKFDLSLFLQGQARYPVELGGDPRGNVTRMDNALERLPEALKYARERLTILHEQTISARAESEKPWPMEDVLREKSARLIELNASLSAGGESTQAPAGEEEGPEL